MVGLDVVKIGNKRRDEFENEHNVISTMQVGFFVSLESILSLFLLSGLHNECIHVYRLANVVIIQLLELDSIHVEFIIILF